MKIYKLKKGKTYEIRFKGNGENDSYEGIGVFTGKTDDINGKVYGFKLSTENDICWFPLEDIFEQ